MDELNELFKSLPSNFNWEAAKDMEATMYFEVIEGGSDHWAVVISNGICSVQDVAPTSYDAHFRADTKTFLGILKGEINSMKAFMSGKLKVDGNIILAQKLNQFFPKE